MNFEVTDQNLKKVGSVDLNDGVFGVKSKPYLWHEMVKWQLARKRQGTAKTKQRNEVSGTTKKLYRQKGTGQARHGSSKAPIFVGGGQTFGPIPRSYDYNIPKQTKRLAICSALSMKKDKSFFRVVNEIKMNAMKTKEAIALLAPFAFKSALIIDTDNANLHKAVRNLKGYKFVKPEGLNIYDLMKFEGLIVTKAALSKLQEALSV